MDKSSYQICNNCVVDTSDPTITFNTEGICAYCQNFEQYIKPNWNPNDEGIKNITPLINKIKYEGKNKDYDCIIGLSGGMDSSFVTYVAKEKFGLRPLIFHCDAGWNSDLGISNIQKIIEGLDLDLVTEVVNWEEMKDLQRAFFKSQVPFVDQPQDLALFSAMYNFAAKNGFKYVITGGNNSTEVVRESIDWTYFSTDMRYVRDIHHKFGEYKLKTFPICDIFKYKIYYRFIKGIRVIKLLDYYPFIKNEAIQELSDLFGWQPYQMKHYESRFTKFFESYWTPRKHGYDKRRVYFSSEILTGQMTREEAIDRLSRPELSEEEMKRDFTYVAKKLDWTNDEFIDIFNAPNKSFRDYKNNYFWLNLGAKLMNLIGVDRRLFK
jgi:N-acetyl sugar amidotransferase